MTEQLPLDLKIRSEYTFENFITEDDFILAALQQKSLPHLIFIYGEQYSGRTHLLQACCHAAENKNVVYLDLKDPAIQKIEIFNELLDGLESCDIIAIDNIDFIAGKPEFEEALFHLYNRCQTTKCRWITSAQKSPKNINFSIQDLCSRLCSGLTIQLTTKTETQMITILQHQASRCGLTLSDDCARYLLTHYPRDMKSQLKQLEKIDRAALIAQRKITIPFIKSTLA